MMAALTLEESAFPPSCAPATEDSDIERHYKEICKERGIDPHAKVEPETAPIEQPEDAAKVSDRQQTGDLTYYVAECMEFPNLGEKPEASCAPANISF